MILPGRILLLAGFSVALLGACASPPPPADFLQGIPLATPDGDSLKVSSLRGHTTAFLFLDPLCPMVQEASQRGGMLQDLEASLRDDGSELVLVGVSTPGEKLGTGEFRAWQRDVRLQGRMILDTAGILARREGIRRLPWALVLDAKGTRRYSGPAESMQKDTSEFVLTNAARRAMFGMDTPAGEEEGDGCPLNL